ncbi:MAG: helix-turn-helix transcriptional regulator [Bacteroidetes bacterium]|nr:helix-turn-helix transcriptional regulator [Bacteroidota bacterium]MCB9043230.1 helix-turn-helix transcriptional regulator [Chitinophagales bacterium]
MPIGIKIRKWRELRNYSQTYMAQELGISQKSYSKLENGEVNCSVRMPTKNCRTVRYNTGRYYEFKRTKSRYSIAQWRSQQQCTQIGNEHQ